MQIEGIDQFRIFSLVKDKMRDTRCDLKTRCLGAVCVKEFKVQFLTLKSSGPFFFSFSFFNQLCTAPQPTSVLSHTHLLTHPHSNYSSSAPPGILATVAWMARANHHTLLCPADLWGYSNTASYTGLQRVGANAKMGIDHCTSSCSDCVFVGFNERIMKPVSVWNRRFSKEALE